MSNFEEVKFPSSPTIETHLLNKDDYFTALTKEELYNSVVVSTANSKKLSNGTKVIVLEEGLGKNAIWNYVKYNNNFGYILKNSLSLLDGTKPSLPISTDQLYQPDVLSAAIDWRERKPNIVYQDKNKGKYFSHIELPYEKVDGREDLKQKIKEGYYKGISLILKETGKRYDQEYVTYLTNNFFKFGEAEEYYFPLRNCSTLRVFVTIPSRYLFSGFISDSIVNKKGAFEETDLAELLGSAAIDGDLFSDSEGEMSEAVNKGAQENKFLIKEYNNYSDFSAHINDIRLAITQQQLTLASGQWDITPDGLNINFLNELANLELFYNIINRFINSNISKKPFDDKVNFDTVVSSILGEPWSGKLRFVINKDDIIISDILLIDNNGNSIPLNIGYYSVLQNDVILNKTTINYILKINKENKQNTTDVIMSAAASTVNAVTGVLEQPIENAQQAANTIVQAGNAAVSGAVNAIANVADTLEQLSPDYHLKKFLLEKHYPQVTDIIRKPLDIASCVQETYNLLKEVEKNNKPAILRQYDEERKKYEKRKIEYEGSTFDKLLAADIKNTTDPRIRKLLGLDPIDFSDPVKGLNEVLSVINLFDIQRWLLEALKCSTVDFNPQAFNDLIKQYGNVKKALDAIAITTVCNPIATNVLKAYTTFKLPILPTTNPNKALIEQLIKLIVQVTNDLVVLGIRQLLTNSFKNCADDKRRKNLPNAISNNLTPDAGVNDPAIDDLLNDLSGGIYNDDGTINPASREAAKEKLKQLLDELSNCLSTRELCALLTGKTINDSVIDAIVSFIKRKYNTPNADINLANKFNNREYIINFFLILGRNLGDELQVCEDILNQPADFNKNPLCDDGTINALTETLLSDKGLTPDLIDDLLKDINNKKAKNLDDLLNFLNSDDPFKFDNIPSILCKNGVPPAVKVSPSIDTFKGLLNNLFKDVYDNFDSEAPNWYTTTYSTKGQTKEMSFDENGKLVFSAEVMPESDKSGSQTFIPNFLFDQNINQAVTNSLYTNKSHSYNVSIDGKKQRDLDVTIIESSIKTDLSTAESSLRDFLSDLNIAYNSYLAIVGIQVTTEVVVNSSRQRAGASDSALQALENNIKGLSPTFFNEFIKFVRLQDLFMVNDIADIEELKKQFPENRLLANSLILADSGVAVYISICEFLIKHRAELSSMINQISQKLKPSSQTTLLPSETVGSYNDILTGLDKAIADYNSIKNSYELLLNSSIKYPSYDVKMNFGLENYTIFKSYDEENLYDINNVLVNKNSKQYLKFGSRHKLKQETKNYILNDLKIDKEKFNKESVFNAYIDNKKVLYDLSIEIDNNFSFDQKSLFSSLDKVVLQTIIDNIKSKNNLFDNLYTPESAGSDIKIQQPYTRFFGDKLVIKQTPEQKACNVRPHYLDIDDIKADIISNKEKSLCSIEEAKNENIINNTPINSSDLEKLDTSETQNIILNGTFRLAIRAYLHDILLRGINLFSYYDPQSLCKDESFITFMAYLVESEMRGTDNTFFSLMTNHFNKMSNLSSTKTKEELPFLQRDMFRDTVALELQEIVLPKLAKRINEDTNAYLKQSGTNKNIKLVNIYSDAKNVFKNKLFFEKQDGVYLTVENKKAIKIFSGSYTDFCNSTEYDLFFDYLFPQAQYLNFLFMNSVLCVSTRRSILDTFKNTKSSIRNLAVITQTNGANVVPDLGNAQDIINNDSDDFLKKFIFDALFKTPYLIFKGYAEMSEPNLLISTSIYKVLSAIIPETPSFIIPPTSGLIFLAGVPPINPIVYGLYLGGLFWYEDKSNNSDASKKSMLLNAFESSMLDRNCENITNFNSDKVRLNSDKVYEILITQSATIPETTQERQINPIIERKNGSNQ